MGNRENPPRRRAISKSLRFPIRLPSFVILFDSHVPLHVWECLHKSFKSLSRTVRTNFCILWADNPFAHGVPPRMVIRLNATGITRKDRTLAHVDSPVPLHAGHVWVEPGRGSFETGGRPRMFTTPPPLHTEHFLGLKITLLNEPVMVGHKIAGNPVIVG